MGNVGVKDNYFASTKLIVRSIGLNPQAPLENVDNHKPWSAVPFEAATWFEGEEDLGHVGSMKQRDLAMTVPGGMVLGPQLLKGFRQGKDVRIAGEPLRRGGT